MGEILHCQLLYAGFLKVFLRRARLWFRPKRFRPSSGPFLRLSVYVNLPPPASDIDVCRYPRIGLPFSAPETRRKQLRRALVRTTAQPLQGSWHDQARFDERGLRLCRGTLLEPSRARDRRWLVDHYRRRMP